ncbi:TetR/AcrR family transcriptional regulator [Demequina mangrovi]|uniref:Transcriptional regulator, TetR family n=1 Tax=Demequina mangrovi TaxID=1043493 RepID=A0A1H7AUL6_9MICO|nr:TetR/AcrR family transcriptional regulator [Demequina mangrovi]SEJ68334.1 transcriptional regulator, TetR family [Demequina mangrovi]
MTTDPRFARSADALADAVLTLAAERPIERIAVTEIARLAGVTRATFYNHATSPAALLTSVLLRELDTIRDSFFADVDLAPDRIEETWRASELVLVEHVLAHADVYRRGLAQAAGRHGSVLSELLAGHVEASLLTFARDHGVDLGGPDALRIAMAAAFVGQGTAGALRVWLEGPAPLDPEVAVGTILSLIPPLWFTVARA